MRPRSAATDDTLGEALALIQEVWTECSAGIEAQLQIGAKLTHLPDLSLSASQRKSRLGSAILERLQHLDTTNLPHEVALTLRLARFKAQTWSREAAWYWLVIDPLSVGFFGLFLPTAYCGGFLLSKVHSALAGFSFSESGDADRYLGLIADYARLIDQFTARTSGQAERGILMPEPQIIQARQMITGLKLRAQQTLAVTPERLRAIPSLAPAFSRELQNRIEACVVPSFERLLSELSDSYAARAPVTVGMAQYPGGPEIYAELAKLHTTLDLTPTEIHSAGNERLARLEASMAGIRRDVGFAGDGAAFIAHLNEAPRWRAHSADEVAALFRGYLSRFQDRSGRFFSNLPRSQCDVLPLPEALQGAMTYGYYDAPRRDRPEGRYLFNTGNLTRQALFSLGALAYHELMPGHHLQLSIQQERVSLHPLARYSLINAYNEGWAEYAATLADEMGLYHDPQERYGRLLNEAFLTCRLVVDTGMNALGWTFEQARDFMRQHTALPETEIGTELLRYSCDTPGQALAYKLGDTKIWELRERMRHELGAEFDLKRFHEMILIPGALPLSDLAWHIEYEIGRLKGAR